MSDAPAGQVAERLSDEEISGWFASAMIADDRGAGETRITVEALFALLAEVRSSRASRAAAQTNDQTGESR